jgi:hypothetical protein
MDPLDQELYDTLIGLPQEKVKKIRFLKTKGNAGTDKEARHDAEISQITLNAWIDTDETFRQHYCFAGKDFAESLIEEALRQVREGHEVPIVYKGEVVGSYRDKRMTTRLLEKLMVGFNPGIRERDPGRGEIFETVKALQAMVYSLGLAKEPQQLPGQVIDAEVVPISAYLERYPEHASDHQSTNLGDRAHSTGDSSASGENTDPASFNSDAASQDSPQPTSSSRNRKPRRKLGEKPVRVLSGSPEVGANSEGSGAGVQERVEPGSGEDC